MGKKTGTFYAVSVGPGDPELLLKLFRRKTLTWQYLVSVLDA